MSPHNAALADAVPYDPSSRTGWAKPDTSILVENRLPPPELPLEVFGEAWGNWISQTALGSSAPPDYVVAGLLTASTAFIGNARQCSPWQGWKESLALWSCLVGPPSHNKSPALDPLRGIIRRIETSLATSFDDTLRQHEADLEAAKQRTIAWEDEVKTAIKNKVNPPIKPLDAVEPDKPVRPRIAIMSATEEEIVNVMVGQPKGLIQIRDELSSFLNDMGKYNGSGDRGFYLEAFGGRSYVSDRVKYSGTPKIIPHLTLSVLGTTQPDKVSSAILKGDDDGLAARFLYVWPERARLMRPTVCADDEWAYNALYKLHALSMGQNDEGDACPVIRLLSDEAAHEFETWWQGNQDAIDQETGLLAGHMGKMPGLVLRLALTLELLWWSASSGPEPERVSKAAVIAAIGLASEYFVPMARRVFGDAGLPKEQRLATALAKHIVKNRLRRVNAREIYRSREVPGINNADTCKQAIGYLEDCDFVKADPSRAGDTRGAQRSDYVVNPLVYEVTQ